MNDLRLDNLVAARAAALVVSIRATSQAIPVAVQTISTQASRVSRALRIIAVTIIRTVIDIADTSLSERITLKRQQWPSVLAAQAEEVSRCLKVEFVLEVDVPSNTIAAAVDVVLDLSIFGDLSRNLEFALGHNGGLLHNSSFSIESPSSEGKVKNLELEAELDRQREFELNTNLSRSFDAVLE